ncbi:DEAD/DEAH box helicase [Sporomusa acidovorans]|uniref:DEAD-box ATP-dependent RNA helicase CshA n=1 Tax=Sporomusa acidovorans (strain ATCC 49682 / DSM 3132 / Mol) TaxID=1123286 RepID=A0ABZ3J3M2_SPOA4|nr:DEAD/DEAH box helicase [Sporomusa acidovorans]OZC20141.1 DEAD-box ATP-dependent RNA helicase CshA [Sporomusa acidovorans DSM 3132]SDD43955.1 ATP-dependent RNA helicase DeaD [Sporomusa acidovorans]
MKDIVTLFGNISLSKKIAAAITEMGFEEPSPIQSQTIPLVLAGKDVLGQAQTGTGKTAAFGIPIMERITDVRQIQALVLTPTRELAIQVSEELAKIGKFKRIKTLPIYGGQAIERQIRTLKSGVQVVIGTPGRLLDHIRRNTIKLDHVKVLVLDEADEMLDMGFIDDLESILQHVPTERQTLLFSATMPSEIMTLANKYMKDRVTVTISKEQLTVPLIDQIYYETRDKLDGLCRVLDSETIGRAIIFCRTKKGVDELVASLSARGYLSDGLHGDLSQAQRDRVMKKFRDGKLDILIATDVAARGLDIEHITHVINYDIPQDPESYVHRIGRTGRAGKKGVAITFIQPREYRQLKIIEREIKTRILRRQLPSPADILERQTEVIKNQLTQTIARGGFDAYSGIIADLAADYDPIDLAAAALKLFQEGYKEQVLIEKKQFGNTGAEPGMVRLFINAGRAQKIQPQDIVRTIAEEADIEGSIIGVINIYDRFTFVEVPETVAERVLSVMNKNTIKGYRINIEPAKGR